MFLQILIILIVSNIISSCKHINNSTIVDRDFYFSSQKSIDDFIISYPQCTIIEGDIKIGATMKTESIKDLSPFRNIRKVKGNLLIRNNTALTHLDGFESIDTIFGAFELAGNNNLISLKGLKNLKYVRDVFSLGSGTNFKDLIELENLEHVGKLRITGTKLRSLTGLESLKSITSGIVCHQNFNLESIDALRNVQKVAFLQLQGSPLKSCKVQSICKLLTDSPDSVTSTSDCDYCED